MLQAAIGSTTGHNYLITIRLENFRLANNSDDPVRLSDTLMLVTSSALEVYATPLVEQSRLWYA